MCPFGKHGRLWKSSLTRVLRRTSVSGLHLRLVATVHELIPVISNFQGGLIVDLLRYARIEPSVLQVEIHPYLTQEALIALCKHHDIAVTAYSSFGPASWLELDMHKQIPSLLEHDLVGKLSRTLQRSMRRPFYPASLPASLTMCTARSPRANPPSMGDPARPRCHSQE